MRLFLLVFLASCTTPSERGGEPVSITVQCNDDKMFIKNDGTQCWITVGDKEVPVYLEKK